MDLAALTDRPAVPGFPQRVRYNVEGVRMNFDHERICSKAVGVTRTKFGRRRCHTNLERRGCRVWKAALTSGGGGGSARPGRFVS